MNQRQSVRHAGGDRSTMSSLSRLLDQYSSKETNELEVGKFSNTATYIKSTIYVTLVLAILAWAAGIAIAIIGSGHLALILETSETVAEMVQLICSLVVTFCSDGLGYVHSISLRWSLYRENRLEYNTNFRLFTSARTSLANRWYMNLLSAGSLVLCYASISVILLRADSNEIGIFAFNSMAIMALGIGLSGQLLTAVLCLRHHEKRISSWNPNPLWNTLTATRLGTIEHRAGRCMHSVFDRDIKSEPRRPDTQTSSLWHLRSTRWIVLFLWALCGVGIGLTAVVIYIPAHDFEAENPFQFDWNNWDGARNLLLYFDVSIAGDPTIPIGVQYLLGLLFMCIVQGLQTLGFHCVELLVNMNRDEHVWRKASRPCGTLPSASGPLIAALTSWQTVTLTVLKALLHWLIGQSLVPRTWSSTYDREYTPRVFSFEMSSSRFLIFAIMTFIVAAFTTMLAFWPLRGAQPAAWGHLQTLTDLVDNWGEPGATLWWGDKGVGEDGVRHAGTADFQGSVGEVDTDSWYAGEGSQNTSFIYSPRYSL